ADVVKNVVGDRIVRADAFHAGRVFLVATRVAQVHVLGVAHGDAAARDVGDIVPDDRRVDDVVDHRDPFAAAVLDGVADQADRVGVVHRDHPGQGVGDLVFAVVPVAVAVRDEH